MGTDKVKFGGDTKPPVKEVPRGQRTSFVGKTSLYERKKKKDPDEPEMMQSMSADAITQKEERRKRTFTTMGVTASVRAAMDDALGGILDGVDGDADAETKLQSVMIAAKQSGMSVDKIFAYFKNSTTDNSDLTPAQFGDALKALSPSIFDLTEEEIHHLVSKFDTDGDGLVSYPEFRHYCYYQIKAVCWRAERLRMEKSGAMDSFEAEYNHTADTHHVDPEAAQEIKIEPGPCIYEGNKLYWRTNTTIYIRMYHNSEISCICILCWSETDDKHFPPIFVNSDSIPVDEAGVDSKVAQLVSDQGKQKKQETHENLRKQVLNNLYSDHILARLKIPDSSNPFPKNDIGNKLPPLTPRTEEKMPFLTLLSTDLHNIMVPRPANFVDPPPFEKLIEVDLGTFESLLASANEDNATMKRIAANAERMSKLLSMSVMAFSNADKNKKRKGKLNVQRQRWLDTFTLWIVRQQVDAVREVLKDSPAYIALEAETAEKAAAAAAGLTLPPI
mmetsp:Transcript_24785/g.46611  ORF Transcript_24785/g.46611 Transcript_24785/m.46611 type:complete len:503 (+) Transcript_24785:67-1575(+)|eukprot:CAMPEP_0182490776 /NCGR_PEP_ID=MMETSP1321-20130603/503_1 /TAXON_ID=91990 /ORGANISM="Bolidomonas sp., Strain RCC1657" /LENGTH=502 /DNA_ID=CAMNT_0024693005 /DNA_START=20 /DNA_END=1528 /DNA_ORIENTATION=-